MRFRSPLLTLVLASLCLPAVGALGAGPVQQAETLAHRRRVTADGEWLAALRNSFTEESLARTCPETRDGHHLRCFLARAREGIQARGAPTETGIVMLAAHGATLVHADERRARGRRGPDHLAAIRAEYALDAAELELFTAELLLDQLPGTSAWKNEDGRRLQLTRKTVILKTFPELIHRAGRNLRRAADRAPASAADGPDASPEGGNWMRTRRRELESRHRALRARQPGPDEIREFLAAAGRSAD